MDDKPEVDRNFKCCFSLAVIAFIFNIVSFVSPYWIVSYPEYDSQFVRIGLWEACFNGYVHPEDYISKLYYGCWYIYWPEYYYIRDWLNPGWFYGVQMMASLALICNGLGFIILMLQFVETIELNNKKMNLLTLLCEVVAVCCHIIDVVAMGAMSRDRQWLPRPDQNHVSWSFAFAVLAGFFTIFCCFQLILHYIIHNWAPEVIKKQNKDSPDSKEFMMESGVGRASTIKSRSGINQHGPSTIYSQSGMAKPSSSHHGATSGAMASAKAREAMTQKANQKNGSMSSLNNPLNRNNRSGSQHSLASMGRGGGGSNFGGGSNLGGRQDDFRGSMSSLHSTNRRPRTPAGDDTIV